ncbi:MAG: alpha/beta hydrolase [Gammaproteobacteria bacterium]|nr:alpha/beta hydrolase [Gammaproteobacteria bacterium]
MTSEDWPHGIYGAFDSNYNQHFMGRLEENFAEAVLQLAAEGNNQRTRASYDANTLGFQQVREYLEKLAPEPLIQVWKSLSLVDYREVLPRITVPTMLVHGDESQFYSVELANYVQQAIPNAQLHIYERTDHSPHMWQKARFIEDLRSFTMA